MKRVIALAVVAIVAWSGVGQPVGAAINLGTVASYGAADVVNPMRGQYNNLKEGLFPQLNPAQSGYPNWPGTQDSRHGYTWAQLQPTDPASLAPGATDAQKYDFSAIDTDIAAAAARGERFTFRVVAFASCCEASYPANTNMKVPAWLRGLGGATSDYVNAGVTHVIPDWNNATYLTNLEELIAALGRRYNKDERVANFELSGYGDFSENHNTFMRDTLGLPGPDAANSVAQLGYYSQYEDQYITKSSLIRVVDANLKAFPDTQIQVTPQNPEIVKQALRDSTQLAGLTRPVGLRADCLAVFEPPQTWAVNQWSWYVQNGDPILPVVLNRWRTAPISTEWCTWVPGTEQQYFEQGLKDTVNYHVSQIASTGHPYQFSGSSMPSNLYQLWQSAAKYSGYRYAMTGASVPDTITQGTQLPLSVNWTNFGVAPVYDDWRVQYDVRDSGGATVASTISSFSLKTLQPSQNYTDTDDEPLTASATDAQTIGTSALTPGSYTVVARVVWNQHKTGGTNTVNFAPMNLAMAGRDGSGGYQVGSFVVAASPSGTSSNPVDSVVSSGAVATPGAPNTGAGKMSGLSMYLIVAIFAACLMIASLAMVAWRSMLR